MVDGSILMSTVQEFSFIMYERYLVTYIYSKCIALNMMKPLGLYISTWWMLFQKCFLRKDLKSTFLFLPRSIITWTFKFQSLHCALPYFQISGSINCWIIVGGEEGWNLDKASGVCICSQRSQVRTLVKKPWGNVTLEALEFWGIKAISSILII